MISWEEAYCAATGCSRRQFRRRVFWRCLPPGAMVVAPLLGGMSGEYFSADIDLIANVARATSLAQIREEIRDYFHDPRNQLWLRETLGLRLSTARLRALARDYLPDEAVPIGAATPRIVAQPTRVFPRNAPTSQTSREVRRGSH